MTNQPSVIRPQDMSWELLPYSFQLVNIIDEAYDLDLLIRAFDELSELSYFYSVTGGERWFEAANKRLLVIDLLSTVYSGNTQ